jgi:hypothetical protein
MVNYDLMVMTAETEVVSSKDCPSSFMVRIRKIIKNLPGQSIMFIESLIFLLLGRCNNFEKLYIDLEYL